MSYLVIMDEEQAALFRIAARSLASLAHVRSKKMGDVDFLADSAGLQREKLRNMLAQLNLPAMPVWSQLRTADQSSVLALCEKLRARVDVGGGDQAFAALWGVMLAARNAVAPTPRLPDVEALDL